MNQVTIIGNLGAAPEVKESKGTVYTLLRIATTERWKGQDGERRERTDWHRVVAFGRLAQTLECLSKGDLVAVEGKLRVDTYEKNGERRTSVQIIARKVEFLKVKAWEQAAPAEEPLVAADGEEDDDIPF